MPSRPTLFTGQYPDLHGVTQTDGLGKMADDSRMRWLPPGEVPTLGHWFRAGGYDTHYDGKWHISHADLTDPVTGKPLATNATTVSSTRLRSRPTSTPTRSTRTASPGGSARAPRAADGQQRPGAGTRSSPTGRSPGSTRDRSARRRAGDAEALRPFPARRQAS